MGRIRLFSDNNNEETVVCMDCNTHYLYDGSSLTRGYCQNCGGSRLEPLSYISNLKEFANKNKGKRRRLFSDEKNYEDDVTDFSVPNKREAREVWGREYKLVTCADCGTDKYLSDLNNITKLVCDNCGGRRFNYEYSKNRTKKLFSDESVPADTDLDLFLKEYKGKEVDKSEIESVLKDRGISMTPQELVDAGYATQSDVDDNIYMFSDVADFQSKLFSELVISVTKEFRIDPTKSRDCVIDSLSSSPSPIPEKAIMLLKRAGRPELPEVMRFSEISDFMKDSGIATDLSAEYGGSSMPLKKFMDYLQNEYPDAPDDILGALEKDRIIKINGSQVKIN